MRAFSRLAAWAAYYSGHHVTATIVFLATGIWLALGPFMGFSTAWNFWANTTTTVLTLLLVVLVQNTQNRETAATQLKLDEIIHALDAARNDTMRAEERTLDEIAEAKDELLTDD